MFTADGRHLQASSAPSIQGFQNVGTGPNANGQGLSGGALSWAPGSYRLYYAGGANSELVQTLNVVGAGKWQQDNTFPANVRPDLTDGVVPTVTSIYSSGGGNNYIVSGLFCPHRRMNGASVS